MENTRIYMASMNAIEKLSKNRQRMLVSEFKLTLNNIQSEISKHYENYADDSGVLSREEMAKYNRMQKFEQYLNQEVGNLTKKQNIITRQGVIDNFMESYYRFGFMIDTSVLVPLSYGLVTKNKLDAILYNPLDLIKWSDRNLENNKLMVRQVKEELMKGMVQGHSYNKVAKEIKNRINIGANKAIKVVQTEMHRSSSAGQLASMEYAKSKGVIMQKRWVSTLDSKTRDSHQKLDGQTVNVDEDFKLGSKHASAPSHFGNPKEDINCRCTMMSVVAGIEPSVRRARGADGKNKVIKYQTYNEWKDNLK
jgi:SPP1 gp7 family putative phage head morphogenesis protein